ncbi:MAG TPA: ACP S-malonyltransferase [Polyangiaceae bacterium]|nr:ACP S-malonyltransferase [Polyangiaceae bacterium]
MKTAWLFPGQGTQEVGMGRALASAFPEAAAIFERADRALGFSIRALCFDGPEAELTLTKHTQPAIVTTSIATLAAIRAVHPNLPAPAYAAGHSLGEYSALVAAGALSLEDAVRTVHLRGRAMQDAVPEGEGGMAAIMGGDRAAVEALCAEAAEGEIVSPANFNAPGQIVISGHKRAVDRAAALAGSKKLKAIPLKVSAPFHCALMAPAARAVEAALAELTLEPPSFPVVANVSALPNESSEEAKRLLVRQIDGPVLWEQTITLMADAGVTRALEIGPGKVLSGLVKRIDKRISVLSVGDADSIAKIPDFLG